MKRRLLATLALLSCMQGCTSAVGPAPVDTSEHAVLPEPVELGLPYGGNVLVPGTDVQIAFDSVLADDRCPLDVTCGREGNAIVRLRLVFGSNDPMELLLNTGVTPTSQTIGGYQIAVLDLAPVPTTRAPIPLAAYSIKVRVASVP